MYARNNNILFWITSLYLKIGSRKLTIIMRHKGTYEEIEEVESFCYYTNQVIKVYIYRFRSIMYKLTDSRNNFGCITNVLLKWEKEAKIN